MQRLVISAGPGCGKTYTGARACKYVLSLDKERFLKEHQHTPEQRAIWEWTDTLNLPPGAKIMYGAYQKSIVPEVKAMLPTIIKCHTINGYGSIELKNKYGYVGLVDNRAIPIIERITGQIFSKLVSDKFAWVCAIKYVEKLKEELLPPTKESLELLKTKYDDLTPLMISTDVVEKCSILLKEMKQVDRNIGIEYIDQVWLPLWFIKSPVYDLGIIDECQDLSVARLQLVKQLCNHIIFVGDPDQAIMSFSGADAKSFERVRNICTDELPLKTTFRLPPNIVSKANRLKPTAKLVGTKTENGDERNITLNELGVYLREPYEENLVLCRYNAPLIRTAIRMMKQGFPCCVKGDNICKGLKKIIEGRKAKSIEDLLSKLEKYESNLISKLNEQEKETFIDKMDTIRLLCNDCTSVPEVISKLDSMYSSKKNSVRFSTGHSAKGLQANNVLILFPPVESKKAKTPEAKEQEHNLHFVMLTRTKKNLYWVHE
jgi:DNA helicase-2/ATP-dependent DNA helicase PcrA